MKTGISTSSLLFQHSNCVIPATERQAYEVSAYREGMRESTQKDDKSPFFTRMITLFSPSLRANEVCVAIQKHQKPKKH
jgi:hypothetical protein